VQKDFDEEDKEDDDAPGVVPCASSSPSPNPTPQGRYVKGYSHLSLS